jgi:hypothetical protein
MMDKLTRRVIEKKRQKISFQVHYYIRTMLGSSKFTDKKRKIFLTENSTSSMHNNVTILNFEPFMDIIKIIRKKFPSDKKKINISEIQIFHPKLLFCGFAKRTLHHF